MSNRERWHHIMLDLISNKQDLSGEERTGKIETWNARAAKFQESYKSVAAMEIIPRGVSFLSIFFYLIFSRHLVTELHSRRRCHHPSNLIQHHTTPNIDTATDQTASLALPSPPKNLHIRRGSADNCFDKPASLAIPSQPKSARKTRGYSTFVRAT